MGEHNLDHYNIRKYEDHNPHPQAHHTYDHHRHAPVHDYYDAHAAAMRYHADVPAYERHHYNNQFVNPTHEGHWHYPYAPTDVAHEYDFVRHPHYHLEQQNEEEENFSISKIMDKLSKKKDEKEAEDQKMTA